MPEEPPQPNRVPPEFRDHPPLNPPTVEGYDLARCIGSGSYGEVWLARSAAGEWRAVKVVQRQTFQKDKPFEREFTGIVKFEPVSRTHEGMVDVLQVGRDEGAGCFYYVMELADDAVMGRDVRPDRYIPKTIGQVLEQRGRLPFDECLRLAMGLASALGHLHDHGLIHRDVKPSNIIYVDGHPKLADIGLVAEVSDAHSFVGTEGYIPPEGPGTPAADLYGLGKVMYEMATGKDRKQYPELPDDFHRQPDHNGLVELNEIIVKACAFQVSERYQSVAEMTADLALLQSGRSVKQARTMDLRLAAARRCGMAATAAALVFGAAYFFSEHQSRRARIAESAATQATQQANERLYDALLAQARLGRRSAGAGRRLETMDAIRQAASIQPSTALRSEAIATLVLHDLKVTPWFKAGPASNPNAIAFNGDFSRFAMLDHEGRVQVRRRDPDVALASLDVPGPAGVKVFFAGEGDQLVINNRSNGEIIYWEWKKDKVLWRYQPPGTALAYQDIDVSPRGDVLIASLYERTGRSSLIVLDRATGMALEPMSWDGAVIQGTRFNPAGNQLALAVGTKVEVLDWPSRKPVTSFKLSHPVTCLAWHPHGKRLAVGDDQGNLFIHTLAPADPLVLQGHSKYVWQVFFSHQGDFLVSISWDGSTRFWDAGHGNLMFGTQEGLGVQLRDDDSELAFTRTAIGAGIWAMVRPAGLRRLSVERSQSSDIRGVDFSPDNRRLISGHGGSWRLWDLESHEVPQRVRAGGRVRAVHFLADAEGSSVIASGAHGARQWRLDLTQGPDSMPGAVSSDVRVLANSGQCSDVSIDGRFLVNAGGAHAEIIDLQKPEARVQLSEPGWEYYQVAFVGGHRWVGTSDRSGNRTRIWEAATGELVHELGPFYGSVTGSPDGKTVVTGSAAELIFWEAGSWEKRFGLPLKLASRDSVAVSVSPDNRVVAAAVDRQAIELRDLDGGALIARLMAPQESYIHNVRFSPNGRWLAAATGEYEIQLWDLEVILNELVAVNLGWELP